MADIHLMLAGDIGFAGGQMADGMAVVNGTTGAAVSAGSGGSFEYPDNILGVLADGAGGFVVIGRQMTGFSGMARYLDNGTLDSGFTVNITATFPPTAELPVGSGGIYQAIQHSTGWLVRGNFTTINGVARNGFARLNADGSVDTSWPSPNTGFPNQIALQAGKAIISADNTFYRVDGSGVDGTFTPTTVPYNQIANAINSIYVQPDDKLVLTGGFANIGAFSRVGIQKLRTDTAAPVLSVPEIGFTNGQVWGVSPHAGGLLIFGSFTTAASGTVNRIMRLNGDNSIDTGFVAPVINGDVNDAIELQSGKILIGGTFTTVNAVTRQRVAVLNTNGTLDTGWVPPTVNNGVYRLHQTPDGKIYIIATPSSGFTTVGGVSMPVIARLNADGTHDNTYFGPVPVQANGSTLSIYQGVLPQSDGKFVLWGSHDLIRGAPMQYLALVDHNGPVSGFVNLAANSVIYGVDRLSDGKYIALGGFTTIGGLSTYQRIARLNTNGSLDTSYPSSTIGSTPPTGGLGNRGIVPLSSNRRLVYTNAGPYLIRLNADGTIDGTYTAPTLNNAPEFAAVQSDGKVILVGWFTTVSGNTRTRMCRLNADGTYDSSFPDVNLSDPGTAPRLSILADNSIILLNSSASFTIGGQSRNRLAKISAAGVVDATWNPQPNGTVNRVRQLSGGQVIVAGNFTTIGGQSRSRLARLNSDGTADTGFVQTNYPTEIFDFHIDGSNRIVHVGSGTNTGNNWLARRDSDGNIDGSFANPGFNNTVFKVQPLADGGYLFGMLDGQVRRYSSAGVVDSTWKGAMSGGTVTDMIYPGGTTVMLLGGFTNGMAKPHARLTRVNADGTLDETYPGFPISPLTISRAFIDSSNEVLVVRSDGVRIRRDTSGGETTLTGYTPGGNVTMTPNKKIYQTRNSSPFAIMRLNADGTDDTGYGDIVPSGANNYWPHPLTNELVVWSGTASNAINLGGVTMSKVARLNANGSIDGSWVGATYSASYTPERIHDAGSGKLYVVARQTGGVELRAVFRVTTTGTFDNWISGGTSPASYSYYVDVDPNDYSVAGWDTQTGTQRRVLRYATGGALVAGWTTVTTGNLFWRRTISDPPGPIKVLPDSKVLVTGQFIANGPASVNKRFNAAVLDTSGVLVPGYDPGIVATGTGLLDVRDGKHYLGAAIAATNARTMPFVALREADGGYSSEFLTEPYVNPAATSAGVTATVSMVRMLPDGRAYIGGRFATLGGGITFGQGGYEIYSLARILPDGSPDRTFANARIEETVAPPPPQAFFPGIVRDLDIQADGRLLVVGEFTMVEGRFSRPRICRLTDTGDLDELFFVTLNQPAWTVRERSDGKIWVGGSFTTVNSNPQAGLVLLNADGSVDGTFSNPLINVAINAIVVAVMPQSDGKVIAAGTFTQINSVSSKSIRRFNTDGSLDTGWDPGISTGVITAAAQDGTGRIYIGTVGAVLRLLPNGSVDPAWTNPFTGTDEIISLAPLPGGGVIVGGSFVLAGRYSNVMLSDAGAVMPDLQAQPLFHTDGTRAFVSRVSWVPTPPMTMFPRMPPSRSYVGRPAEIQYRTYGGTKPYEHSLIGQLPAGMDMDGPVIDGSPTEPGTHYWKVAARDAVGQRIEYLTRFQVTSTDLAWPLFAFNANVTRIDPDGSNQTTAVSTNGVVLRAIRLRNRKILLLGSFTTVGGETRNKVALLHPDGTLDMAFTGPASSSDIEGFPQAADMLPSGKFIIGSERTSPTPLFGSIYRLNADGTIDGGYTIDSRIAMKSVQLVKVLEPDVVLIGGVTNYADAGDYNTAGVFLIDADGAIDEAYINSLYPAWAGTLPDDFFTSLRMYQLRGGSIPGGAHRTTGIFDVHIDENGDFVVCGSFIQTGLGGGVTSETVARAYRYGGHDTSFRTQITGIINPVNYPSRPVGSTLIPQPDGSFVVIGAFNEYGIINSGIVTDSGYAHIDRNGNPATPPQQWADTSAVPARTSYGSPLPDGRIIVHSPDDSPINRRVFPDGQLDASFSSPTVAATRFMPDNAGIDDFSADGTFSFGIQSEELDMFTADGTFYFFGGSPPVPPGPVEELDEGLLIGALLSDLPKYGLREGLRLASSGVSHFDGLVRVMDSIELGDALAVILRALLAEGFKFGGTTAANYRAMMAVTDGLRLAGVASSQLEALNVIAVTFAFAELLRAREIEGLTDDLELGDALANAVQMGARLVEGLLVAAPVTPAVVFGAVVREGFKLGSAGTAILTAIELLREGVNFALHLNLDDGQYVAVVINTESKGTTEYQNYPFNSFARLGGRYYGMTPDGIRELEGPDDAGSPIAARFRLAMSRLGVGNLKRMVAAYLGYSSTGDLRLKTITIQPDGVKRADHYRLLAQPGAPREARVKIGQGLRSVYWGFEVEAIDGAAFAIDLIDMQPIVVEQRIQGQNGGNR